MTNSTNDTLLLSEPDVRRDEARATRDYTADLNRIIRHSLQTRGPATALDHAIRSAARATTPAVVGRASDVNECQARNLAARLNDLLVRRGCGAIADPHRQTVQA